MNRQITGSQHVSNGLLILLLFFFRRSRFSPKLREAVTLRLLIGFGSSDTLGLCTPRDLLISEVFCLKLKNLDTPHWR